MHPIRTLISNIPLTILSGKSAQRMQQKCINYMLIENNRGGDITTGNQTPDRVEEIRLELTKQIFVRNVTPTLVISGAFVQNFFIKFFRKCRQQTQQQKE